jgi:hypothetical protein
VSIKGSPYARFRRSLPTGKLAIVEMAASELEVVQLDDALEILTLMAAERDPRFDRAAAKWIGRLLVERPMTMADARWAIALVEQLPDCKTTLYRLTQRRR